MPQSDPLQILLSHDRWATAQVLDACGKLTAEQFHRRFEIGHGSLHDTLAHVIGVMRALTETLAGWEARPRLEGDGQRRTPAQLRALLEGHDPLPALPARLREADSAHREVPREGSRRRQKR
jgi:uncharacterized damage-inducible protein DinB